MCGAALAGVKRPTFEQRAGFNGGAGNGITITDYTPNYRPDVQQAIDFGHTAHLNEQQLLGLYPGADQGGTFTLSDGTTQDARQVVADNQQRAYGQGVGYSTREAHGGGYRRLVGKELIAAPQAAQPATAVTGASAQTAAVAPASPAPVFGGGGGGGRSTPAPTPKEQTFSDSTSSRRSGRNRKRLSGSNPNATLVTGGEGVLGESNTSGKGLFGE